MTGRDFFRRGTLDVARDLIGMELISTAGGETTGGIIVETEAYMGAADRASHSYRGRTERVRALYGEKGHVYIYLIYGMYWCLNISSGEDGSPECVLIRALEPRYGIDTMMRRRKTGDIHNTADGPGKLTEALGLGGEFYGADVCDSCSGVYIGGGSSLPTDASERIGIPNTGEARHYPWRFTARDCGFLSRPAVKNDDRAVRH